LDVHCRKNQIKLPIQHPNFVLIKAVHWIFGRIQAVERSGIVSLMTAPNVKNGPSFEAIAAKANSLLRINSPIPLLFIALNKTESMKLASMRMAVSMVSAASMMEVSVTPGLIFEAIVRLAINKTRHCLEILLIGALRGLS
jgi:hypothetical protein